jgi:hypothetical protein
MGTQARSHKWITCQKCGASIIAGRPCDVCPRAASRVDRRSAARLGLGQRDRSTAAEVQFRLRLPALAAQVCQERAERFPVLTADNAQAALDWQARRLALLEGELRAELADNDRQLLVGILRSANYDIVHTTEENTLARAR